MTTDYKLPELGENIVKATIVGVLVGVGDEVAKGQGVLEVETDKAVIEVPSEVAGTVTAVHVREGQEIEIGQLLLTVDEAAAAGVAPAAQPAAAPAVTAAPVAKPAVEPAAKEPAAAAPTAPPAPAPEAPAEPPPASDSTPASEAELVAAAPSVRRFARELGVEVSDVKGTGPYGRVTMDDVKTHVRVAATGAAPRGATQPAAAPAGETTKWGPVQREKMSNVRRATAARWATPGRRSPW